ncbi:hypothetical protein [Streptomyces sp. NPDC002825]|uniref:hypothetical protein n=1 Tax=Streptomyces sp. NPDC002825 TaxID=3154666 RepID=UPI00331F4CC0
MTEPDPEAPEPDRDASEPEPDREAHAGEASGPDPDRAAPDRDVPGPDGEAPAGRPRFGTVSVPEPSRTPPARRRDLPSVRAVRLTDAPPAPADRRGPAAVTPVPLPVPRAVPTESRTEEPQP